MSGAGTPWRLVHYGLDGRAKLLRISHIGTRSFFFPGLFPVSFFRLPVLHRVISRVRLVAASAV